MHKISGLGSVSELPVRYVNRLEIVREARIWHWFAPNRVKFFDFYSLLCFIPLVARSKRKHWFPVFVIRSTVVQGFSNGYGFLGFFQNFLGFLRLLVFF